MGNKQEHRSPHRPFLLSQWQFIKHHPTHNLFRNAITNLHCQQYLLQVTSQSDKLHYQHRRSRHQQHLVNLLHCEVFTNFNTNFTVIDFTVRVFLERIPVRLSEIAQLPIDAIPLLIFECLLGFKKVREEHRPVRVTPEMIGFTQNKEVRVWGSGDFLAPWPEGEGGVVDQGRMVGDVFGVFDAYSELYRGRPEMMSFTQALQYVAQIKTVNRTQITLIKVPSDHHYHNNPLPKYSQSELLLKHKESIKSKNELSPQPRRPPNKLLDVTVSSRGGRIDTQQSNQDYRFVVQTVQPLKQSPTPFNQRIHQRQVSTAIHPNLPPLSPPSLLPSNSNPSKPVPPPPLKPTTTSSQKSAGVLIGIESARTTANPMPLYDQFIQLDNGGLQLQLLDDKKSKQAKLNIIEDVLDHHKDDENVKKICKVYNYAIKFDPLMYHQLQKAKGRISKIANQYVLRKLIQVSERDGEDSPVNSGNCNQNPTWVPQLVKQDSELRIREILVKERMRRGEEGSNMDRSKQNRTFFGDKQPRKTAMEMSYATFAKPRASELSMSGVQNQSQYQSQNQSQSSQQSQPEKDKKVEKREMMESFKKEFDKLFEF